MEGSLKTLQSISLLEIIHENRRTGVLELEVGPLTLRLEFLEGQLVGGGLLDWEGLDAIFSFPLHPTDGVFRFQSKAVEGSPLIAFKTLLGEWARINDEWGRFCRVFSSPSRVLETVRPNDSYAAFMGGRSVRNAAKFLGVPLIIAAERAWRGLREHDLVLLRKYTWFGLRIKQGGTKRLTSTDPFGIEALLDGQRNLGEIVQSGVPLRQVRQYLILGIKRGEIAPTGRGWLLRDLVWEEEYASD